MRDAAKINRERARRVTWGQTARFYMRDGVEWVEIVSPHDRSNVVQRPATDDDRERFAAFRTAKEIVMQAKVGTATPPFTLPDEKTAEAVDRAAEIEGARHG